MQGPFEWDLKRLVASFVIAARPNSFRTGRRPARQRWQPPHDLADAAFAGMGTLEIWYTRVKVDDVTPTLNSAPGPAPGGDKDPAARSRTSVRPS